MFAPLKRRRRLRKNSSTSLIASVEDLKKFDVPTLVIHGDDDQVVPIDASGRAPAKFVKGVKRIVYPGAPHGLADTHKDQLNADLLTFINS